MRCKKKVRHIRRPSLRDLHGECGDGDAAAGGARAPFPLEGPLPALPRRVFYWDSEPGFSGLFSTCGSKPNPERLDPVLVMVLQVPSISKMSHLGGFLPGEPHPPLLVLPPSASGSPCQLEVQVSEPAAKAY